MTDGTARYSIAVSMLMSKAANNQRYWCNLLDASSLIWLNKGHGLTEGKMLALVCFRTDRMNLNNVQSQKHLNGRSFNYSKVDAGFCVVSTQVLYTQLSTPP